MAAEEPSLGNFLEVDRVAWAVGVVMWKRAVEGASLAVAEGSWTATKMERVDYRSHPIRGPEHKRR